jgi:hypothetical protein
VHVGSEPASEKPASSSFAVAAVAVPRLGFVLRVALAVLRKGAPNIYHFVKATLLVAANVTLVGSRIDEFTLACCHGCDLQLSLFEI